MIGKRIGRVLTSVSMVGALIWTGKGAVVRSTDNPLRAPADELPAVAYPARPSPEPDSPATVFFEAAFGFYRGWVAPNRGAHCPMTPSCSQYSEEALERNGWIPGLLLTGDRLLRCGHDLHYYPMVRTGSGNLRLDPCRP